jgi:hypothetical protein
MHDTSILEKLRSLVRLTDSPNAHEAALAFQKAKQLAAKHKLNLFAVIQEDDGEASTANHKTREINGKLVELLTRMESVIRKLQGRLDESSTILGSVADSLREAINDPSVRASHGSAAGGHTHATTASYRLGAEVLKRTEDGKNTKLDIRIISHCDRYIDYTRWLLEAYSATGEYLGHADFHCTRLNPKGSVIEGVTLWGIPLRSIAEIQLQLREVDFLDSDGCRIDVTHEFNQ